MEHMEQQFNNSLNICIPGTQEHADELNKKLLEDISIINTRPFLNRMDKINLQDYYGTWAINNLIAMFTFDEQGNFLPDAYSAPAEVTRMLYPIYDLMNYDKQGTLVIDREQYNPALKNLSFFIYMVDEELFEELRIKQQFKEGNCPTFMFFRHDSNGIRVFKDYYALARHLRKQRFITYILGPRTAFYLRFFLHQIDICQVENKYAYGRKEDATLTNMVVKTIQECCAYRHASDKFDYHKKFEIDDYKIVRALQAAFKVNLPEIQKFEHTTHCTRYKKSRLDSGSVRILKKNKLKKYQHLGIMPWHHAVHYGTFWFFFPWDTRTVQMVYNDDMIDINDFTRPVDNGFDLCVRYDENHPEIWQAAVQCKHCGAFQLHNMNKASYDNI